MTKEAFVICEKPDWVTWESIHHVIVTAHDALRKEGLYMTHGRLSVEEIRGFIGDKGKMFVALDGDQVVGTAALVARDFKTWFTRGSFAYCCFAAILPAYQGQGIYGQLIAAREACARAMGLPVLVFDTHEGNTHQLAICRMHGFIPVDYKNRKNHNSVVMAKWLDGCPYSEKKCRNMYALMRWKAFFARPILKVYRGFARNTADTDSADSGIQQAVVIGQGYTGRLGIVRSLAAAGCTSKLIVLQPRPRNGEAMSRKKPVDAYSRYVTDCFFCENFNDAMLLDLLLNHCAVPGRKLLIVPDNDYSASFVDAHRKELEPHFLLPACPEGETSVEAWMDKARQKELARSVGLPVAEATILEAKDFDQPLPASLTYPCFVKPLASLVGGKMWLNRCNDETGLRRCLKYAFDQKGAIRILAEEFKQIGTEYALVGFTDGAQVAIPGILQIVRMGQGWHFGVAVQGRVLPLEGWEDVVGKFSELVRRTGFKGLFDIDFYESDGKIYFCELNLRCGGSGYAITRLGVNLPKMMLDSFNGKTIDATARIDQSCLYFNERMGRDEWYFGRISWKEYRAIRNASQISFIEDEKDPAPWRAYRRETTMLRIKRMFRKLTGTLTYHDPFRL